MATRASGFQPTKQFQHKPKVRRNARDIETDQGLRMSPWAHVHTVSTKVDVARVNWPGIIYLQQACGMFDPTPRLVKSNKEATA